MQDTWIPNLMSSIDTEYFVELKDSQSISQERIVVLERGEYNDGSKANIYVDVVVGEDSMVKCSSMKYYATDSTLTTEAISTKIGGITVPKPTSIGTVFTHKVVINCKSMAGNNEYILRVANFEAPVTGALTKYYNTPYCLKRSGLICARGTPASNEYVLPNDIVHRDQCCSQASFDADSAAGNGGCFACWDDALSVSSKQTYNGFGAEIQTYKDDQGA